MKEVIERTLNRNKNLKFQILNLEREIKAFYHSQSTPFRYQEFAETINELEKEKKIVAIKASRKNMMQPSLYKRYRKVKDKQETVPASEFIPYHPTLQMAPFKKNQGLYLKYKPYIQKLNLFLSGREDQETLTTNERSLEIFDDEKFLASKDGEKFLSYVGVDLEKLGCEKAFEPFFYYEVKNGGVQNVLVIENKDTFHSFKKVVREGIRQWGGIPFQLVIYGEGNKITKSFDFVEEMGIPSDANFYYFGDIDREGVSIKWRLSNTTEREVHWMKYFYTQCWNRKKQTKRQSKKQNWNKRAAESFARAFDDKERNDVYQFLKEGFFIPQETLNQKTIRELGENV